MKKSIWIKVIAAALIAASVFSFAGCSGGLKESDVAYAGPILDNVLTGLKDKDLGVFTKDFDDKLKSSYTQDVFNSFADLLQSKIGDYKSKTFADAAKVSENNVNYTRIIYTAKYTKETTDVMITIVFDSQQKVAGLFFKSPNLAQK